MRVPILVAIVAGCLLAATAETPHSAHAAPQACAPGVKLQFICGVRNPEDLVQVPGTDWIVASGLAAANAPSAGGLTLIDTVRRTASKVALKPAAPRAPYSGCPGPLDPAKFSAHGLNIRAGAGGKAALYVVGHGGREAIEVFEVTRGRGAPTIIWIGCVPVPAGAQMNSVAALPDGRIFATDFYHAPLTMQDALQGKNTGAVYVSRNGGPFAKLAGTDLPGPNGIEVTPDGRHLFVAVTGTSSVMRYDLAATEKPPLQVKTDFRSDNLHWGPDGKLLLAGPGPDPTCRPGQARCPQAPAVGALDPASMAVKRILSTPAEPQFQGLSAAIVVGKTLWLGSYQADRVAFTPL